MWDFDFCALPEHCVPFWFLILRPLVLCMSMMKHTESMSKICVYLVLGISGTDASSEGVAASSIAHRKQEFRRKIATASTYLHKVFLILPRSLNCNCLFFVPACCFADITLLLHDIVFGLVFIRTPFLSMKLSTRQIVTVMTAALVSATCSTRTAAVKIGQQQQQHPLSSFSSFQRQMMK